MNRIKPQFAGLALLAAIASVAGTLASTGAPLSATVLGTDGARPAPEAATILKVRYGSPKQA